MEMAREVVGVMFQWLKRDSRGISGWLYRASESAKMRKRWCGCESRRERRAEGLVQEENRSV